MKDIEEPTNNTKHKEDIVKNILLNVFMGLLFIGLFWALLATMAVSLFSLLFGNSMSLILGIVSTLGLWILIFLLSGRRIRED